MVNLVRVTIELGPYSSRLVRLLALTQGGTITSAAKAMVDLGCSTASDRIDDMSRAIMPSSESDVKIWQDCLLEAEFGNDV